jgi:hypothetical protein
VDRFARQVEVDLAAAEAERLNINRPESPELSSHLLREDVLRRTTPRGAATPERPKLAEAEEAVLDARTRLPFDEPPHSKAALEFRDQLADLCERNPEFLDSVRGSAKAARGRNPTAALFSDAVDLVVTGRAEGVPAAVALEGVEARHLAFNRFLKRYLETKSLPEGLKAARLEPNDPFLDHALLGQRDAAVVRRMSSYPTEKAVANKLLAQAPTAEIVWRRSGPGGGPPFDGPPKPPPPDGGPGLSPEGAPKLPRPPGGGELVEAQAQDLAKVVENAGRVRGERGIVRADFALGYEDLLPSRAQQSATTLFDRLMMEQAKHIKDLPPEVDLRRLKGVGSPDAAMKRAYLIDQLRGFHHVGAEVEKPAGRGPRDSSWPEKLAPR